MEIDLSLFCSVNGAFKFWVKRRRITSISFPILFPWRMGPAAPKARDRLSAGISGLVGCFGSLLLTSVSKRELSSQQPPRLPALRSGSSPCIKIGQFFPSAIHRAFGIWTQSTCVFI